jgi:hypothetical protein
MALDSMYLELQYVNYEEKFYEFVAACGLDKNIADVLVGNKEGRYIFVNKNSDMPFAKTKNGGVIIEIGRDLPDWQEAFKNYFKDHPLITKGKILTREQTIQELKPLEEL